MLGEQISSNFDPAEVGTPFVNEIYPLAPNQAVFVVCTINRMGRVGGINIDLDRTFFSEEDEELHNRAARFADEAICNGGFKLARTVRARHPAYGYPIEGFAVIATR